MSIPKIIHYCWFGGGPIPEKDQKCIESWHRYCPDFEIVRWDESNYDIAKNNYMYEAYRARKWGFVPDFARLDIINSLGGVYLDTDVEIIRPINDLLKFGLFCGFESDDKVAFGLGFGAEPNHPLLSELMSSYDDAQFAIGDGKYNSLPSPSIQTPVLVDWGLKLDGSRQTLRKDVEVLSKDYLCPQSFLTGELTVTENTYSIHHYAMSWGSESQRYQHKLSNALYQAGVPEKLAIVISKYVSVIKTRDTERVIGKIKKIKGERPQ